MNKKSTKGAVTYLFKTKIWFNSASWPSFPDMVNGPELRYICTALKFKPQRPDSSCALRSNLSALEKPIWLDSHSQLIIKKILFFKKIPPSPLHCCNCPSQGMFVQCLFSARTQSVLISDRERVFTSKLWQELFRLAGSVTDEL
jgi:hypothetical protein